MPDKPKSKKGKHLSRSGRREYGVHTAIPHAQTNIQPSSVQVKEVVPIARTEPAPQSRKPSYMTGPSAIRRSFLGQEVRAITVLAVAVLALIIVLANVM